jgi:hypothetical protein
MKIYRKVLSALILVTLIAFTACNVNAQSKTYKIGDSGPAGGWIFYDKGKVSDGWRYLEAAPVDQSKEAVWGCYEISIPDAQGKAIGTGKSNTQAIVKSCSEANIAAKICTAYRGGEKSDWFLPSKDELNLMFLNLHKAGIGGFSDFYYWSSSEYSAAEAWNQTFKQAFSFANDYYFNKNNSEFRVRAIRAF